MTEPEPEGPTQPDDEEPRGKAGRWFGRCSLPRRGERRRLPCIPCYLWSVLFFLFVLLVLWLSLRGG
ncbi:MAG: hypothetical protein ACLF0G_05055 [Candidatus Brocadiia bacterium]